MSATEQHAATTTARPEEEARLAELMAAAPASLAALFLDRVAATPDREAFRYRDTAKAWQSLTWAQVGTAVREVAAGLLDLGIQPQDSVSIASSTRLEWVLADLGILCAGAATSTIYPSTPMEDVDFIMADSAARVAFVEDAGQLAKVREHWDRLPSLTVAVVMDDQPGEAADDAGRVTTLSALRDRGRALLAGSPEAVDQRARAVEASDLATLMYTSGTTGRPKGVRLAHSCWVYEGFAIDAVKVLLEEDLQYLWLPLSHSFGKVLLTAQLAIGFSTAVDGNVDELVDNLAVVRPTFMAGAPRIFEKVHARVVTSTMAEGGVKARIFTWAMGVGHRVSSLQLEGQQPGGLLALQHKVADRLVFSKLKERFGGRVRYFISGSAALSREVAEWFHAAGILVLEGYGLTETSAATFVNRPDHYRFGTVGLPFPGTQVRLDTDGEVLVKGPGVMQGYHQLPGQTAEVMTHDGWLRTGDLGEVVDGFLRITDRKKDLIKTSGGKYVAPQGIEVRFKAVCPYASQIVVHGDGRNYVSALITLDADAMATWAESNGMADLPYEELVGSPQVRSMVDNYVAQLNAGLPRWETIKRFEILPRDLTVEDGDLTPSLKLKRRIVERKYADVLDGLYR